MEKKKFKKKDEAHYIIFRELDVLKVPNAYQNATKIIEKLKGYRL